MKNNLKNLITGSIMTVAFALLLYACNGQNNKMESNKMAAAANEMNITKAVAVLHPIEGSNVHGVVTFTKVENGIKIVADIEGLTPGKHGFHIHEYGDCSAPDGTSAGGHFNPDNKKHGATDAAERHVGDMGNVTADADGNAHFEWTDNLMTFSGPHSIIGRGVIVHAGEDDLVSQPTGDAGSRVACGVIGIAKGSDMMNK
jgi:Cu-Zn family superoxide dismutase